MCSGSGDGGKQRNIKQFGRENTFLGLANGLLMGQNIRILLGNTLKFW